MRRDELTVEDRLAIRGELLAGRDPLPPRKGFQLGMEWACERCATTNGSAINRCKACGTRREAMDVPPAQFEVASGTEERLAVDSRTGGPDDALRWVVGIIAVLTAVSMAATGALFSSDGNLTWILWLALGVGVNVAMFGGLFVLLRAGYRWVRRRV